MVRRQPPSPGSAIDSADSRRAPADTGQAAQAGTPALPERVETAVEDVRRAAEAEALAIVQRAREEARQVLSAARRELTGLVAEIVELRRQRDEALARTNAATPEALQDRKLPAEPSLEPPLLAGPAGAQPKATSPASTGRARFFVRGRAVLAGASLLACVILALIWVTLRTPDEPADSTASPVASGDGSPADATAAPRVSGTVSPARATAPPSGASTVGYTVTAEAIRDVWIRPDVDGRRSAGYVLKAGTRRSWTARSNLRLRVGDAGAVRVSVNGGPAAPLGRNGAVLTETFGLVRPPSAGTVGPATPTGGASRTAATSPPPSAQPALSSPSGPGSGGTQNRLAGTNLPGTIATSGVTPVAPLPAPPAGAGGGAPVAPSETTPGAALDGGLAAPAAPTREVLLVRDRQWFAALYDGNRAAALSLQAPRFEFLDERPATERPSYAGGAVSRSLRDVEVHVAGEGAVLSGTMIEHAAGRGPEFTSRFSEVWVSLNGEWRLLGVRISPMGGLPDR